MNRFNRLVSTYKQQIIPKKKIEGFFFDEKASISLQKIIYSDYYKKYYGITYGGAYKNASVYTSEDLINWNDPVTITGFTPTGNQYFTSVDGDILCKENKILIPGYIINGGTSNYYPFGLSEDGENFALKKSTLTAGIKEPKIYSNDLVLGWYGTGLYQLFDDLYGVYSKYLTSHSGNIYCYDEKHDRVFSRSSSYLYVTNKDGTYKSIIGFSTILAVYVFDDKVLVLNNVSGVANLWVSPNETSLTFTKVFGFEASVSFNWYPKIIQAENKFIAYAQDRDANQSLLLWSSDDLVNWKKEDIGSIKVSKPYMICTNGKLILLGLGKLYSMDV
ncbi:MAG: hypothetical protein NC124_02045 [Clostridium sp.]|nr:hypothetical protein [Clostridium sp.]